MQSLKEFAARWEPTEACCKEIHETFCQLVNEAPDLKQLRDWVEQNAWGMGERSFYWTWKLICAELPDNARMLEIGVHRGQVLALWRMLKPKAHIAGISPFDGAEMGDTRDYEPDVLHLFERFGLSEPALYRGMSEDPAIIKEMQIGAPYDAVYIDGGHSYETTRSDIINYSPLVRSGGFLVIDDCACRFPHPWGYFAGITSVCKAVDSLLPPGAENSGWEHVGAVVHNRIWQKI